MTDLELIQRIQRRDRRAFEEFYERHQAAIFGFARGFFRDESVAEEAVQDIFFKIFRSAPQFESRSKVTTWMWSIARNQCIDLQRKKGEILAQDDSDPYGEVPSTEPDPEVALLERAGESRVLDAIRSLPERQREALLLSSFGQFSYEELSNQLGMELPALKSLLHRARIHCAKLLGEKP